MTDKKLKNMLKSQGKEILPADGIKENIKRELFKNTAVSSSKQKNGAKNRNMRLVFATVAACCCVALAVISVLFFLPIQEKPVSDTYLSIDINPAVEITADSSDTVTEVRALNSDAALLLYGENLVGMDIADAADKVVSLAADLGYLSTTSENQISILAVNDSTSKEQAVQNAVSEKLALLIQNKNLNCNVSVKSKNTRTNEAALLGVSLGKMELINEVRAKYGDISKSKAKKMNVKQLNELLKNYDAAQIADTVSELDSISPSRENLSDAENALQSVNEYANRVQNAVGAVRSGAANAQNNLNGLIEEFNIALSDYSYSGDSTDLEAVSDHFENALAEAREAAKLAREDFEQQLNTVKNEYRRQNGAANIDTENGEENGNGSAQNGRH